MRTQATLIKLSGHKTTEQRQDRKTGGAPGSGKGMREGNRVKQWIYINNLRIERYERRGQLDTMFVYQN